MFISSYHVTVFMRRSPDVLDNRIWVSAPVWWDQNPRVAWLHALQQAEQLGSQKQSLPRLLVPFTGACSRITPQLQLQQQPAAGGHQRALPALRKRRRPAEHHVIGPTSSSRRTRPRTAEQHSAQHGSSAGSLPQRALQSRRLQASSDEGKEEDKDSQPSFMAREAKLPAGLDAEDILPLSALGEKIVELCYDNHRHILKVRHPPFPVSLYTL